MACVAGAIAGARDGAGAIPSGWAEPVHGRVDTPDGTEHHDLAALRSVATALAGRTAA